VLIGGQGIDQGPDWSPDGTRIAFVRAVGANQALMVADADGLNVQLVTPDPFPVIDGFVWSPDGSRFAIASTSRSLSSISIAEADGSQVRALDLGYPADHPAWTPDGHALLVRMRTPDGTGLFPISVPDGVVGEPIAISDTTTAFYAGDRGANEFLEPIYSTDGSRIVYIQGQPPKDGVSGVFGGVDTRNHVVNADGSDDRVVEFSPTSDYEDGAWFSPDGTRLSMVIREGDTHQIAIMTLDGSRPPVATEPEEDPNAMPAIWSPDGELILAVRVADGVSYLIDPDTGDKTTQPWLADWADWQPIPIVP
jgi:TolB protein